jgi:biopolymer transport protein ExbB
MLLLGQADAAPATQIQSVWDFVLKGGPMMIPIGLCSLIALTVIVERMASLRRRNVIPPDFLPGLKSLMDDQDSGRAQALEYCENSSSPLAAILAAGIKRLSESVDLLEKHIQDAGQRAVLGLRKYLRTLSVIASICPLMGLLGTIFGMIKAFQTVASSGEALGKTELLAEGIYQAMITTAAGLLVAIPVMIAYHWISSRIDRLVAEMDRMTVEFVEEYAYSAQEEHDGELRLRRHNGAEEAEPQCAAASQQ